MTTISEIEIIHFKPKYARAYKDLNLNWIRKYFVIEPHDEEQLDNPENYIIKKGGFIFFAKYEGEIAGTCALIKTSENEYELAKMAVTESMQGKQIGKKIGLAVLEHAKAVGAKRVWLESNRKLATAINLYHKLGFIEVPIDYTPYARADIRMEIRL